MGAEQCEEAVNTQGCQISVNDSKNCTSGEDKEEPGFEPYVGLEFNTIDDAETFYQRYASNSGFSVRRGQFGRSKINGSVQWQKYVCKKEGFNVRFALGCLAYIRVQKQDSGKWVVDRFQKDHNHDFKLPLISCSHGKAATSLSSFDSTCKKSHSGSLEVRSPKKADAQTHPVGTSDAKYNTGENEEQSKLEPLIGMEFDNPEEAQDCYSTYAQNSGFKVRAGQLQRSNGTVVIRRYVCSKEGFQCPGRVGCCAMIRIKKQASGKWILDRIRKDHNHDLESPDEVPLANVNCNLSSTPRSDTLRSSRRLSLKNVSSLKGDDASASSADKDDNNCSRKKRKSSIGSDWYSVILEYLRNEQAKDPGFFYAVEVDDGRCMSIFWADSGSRFSCSQFGDVVVFDTRYRINSYVAPFASFFGVNHHRQPVLLGCALVADESKESFTWLFQTWRMAMSGCLPVSIKADQDSAIRQAVSQVFPGANYCYSMWHIKAKGKENLNDVLAMHKTFKHEYENCINKSQTPSEFESAWETLLDRYKLKDNKWLKEMYEDRELWVPLYVRGTFCAGINTSAGRNSFFGNLIFQMPLKEFISRYEKAIERYREEEQKEDFIATVKHEVLKTKEPIEMQCEQLYTRNSFLRFRKELMECRSFDAKKSDAEGNIGRYLVYKHGNEEEKDIVTFNGSNLDVTCSCQMFESEGFLCKHILRVFQMLDIKEVPSQYILRRWTKDCEYGTISDVKALRSHQECTTSMVWSLRKEASKFIDLGTMSMDRYNFAFNIFQEGKKKLHTMEVDANYEHPQKKRKV